jgi:hypothetical protein
MPTDTAASAVATGFCRTPLYRQIDKFGRKPATAGIGEDCFQLRQPPWARRSKPRHPQATRLPMQGPIATLHDEFGPPIGGATRLCEQGFAAAFLELSNLF